MGNAELYEKCLLSLFEEQRLGEMREALSSRDYDKAFQAAHALKGVTGNLGLNPLYEATCALVESLRAGDYLNVEAEYEAVRREFLRAQELTQETPQPTLDEKNSPQAQAPSPPPKPAKKKPAKRQLTLRRLTLITLGALVLVVISVRLLFSSLTGNFKDNVSNESSSHLEEINYQIKLYINDVLDMSRIESGQAVIESTPFNIKAELVKLADIVRPLCRARDQSFDIDFEALGESSVLGDRVKLAQVLMNILGNAVKFTPPGGTISFKAAQIPSLRDGITAVRFTVRDNGIGIPAEHLESIFDPFMRVDDKRVSNIEGTGLGLSICHSYVNAMGGSISCESEAGKGSVFTVELFFEETNMSPELDELPAEFKETPFSGRRCLLCEDHSINQIIAKTLLERVGFEVDIASDGHEGVERFALSKPGYYDIIYMDIQMPVMDGYEATRAIRRSAHKQAETIPIVAMTANVFAEDVEKARVCGMNAHLGKPISLMKLIVETDKLLNTKDER